MTGCADRKEHDRDEALSTINEAADHLESGAVDIVRNVEAEVDTVDRAAPGRGTSNASR